MDELDSININSNQLNQLKFCFILFHRLSISDFAAFLLFRVTIFSIFMQRRAKESKRWEAACAWLVTHDLGHEQTHSISSSSSACLSAQL